MIVKEEKNESVVYQLPAEELMEMLSNPALSEDVLFIDVSRRGGGGGRRKR